MLNPDRRSPEEFPKEEMSKLRLEESVSVKGKQNWGNKEKSGSPLRQNLMSLKVKAHN